MYKKLIYLTSLVLVLSLTGEGWPKASNPDPDDGAVYENMWASLGWRPGEHAVSFDIYFGENYDDVKHGTGGTFQGNQDQHMKFFIVGFPGHPYPNGLVPGTTYYWRIDEINDQHPDSPWVGDVWSFMITPSTAHAPEPADGADFVDPGVILSWEPGFGAKLHTVYFGDSFAEVSHASGGRPQGATTYNPGLLKSGKTYYWRVDESDGRDTHKGDVWSFTVGTEAPPSDGEGGIIYVDAVHGSNDNEGLTPGTALATIQRGINKGADGDIILVYPGLYREEVDFLGKALVVQGVATGTAGVPVLHNPNDFAVSFYSGEGPDSILKNFIIKNNFMAVFIAGSSPTISNLTIVDNMYGIEASAGSEPDISNIIFWNNSYSDLFGCRARYSRVNDVGTGEGNIDDNPLFVDPDSGDYRLSSNRGRYWPEHDVWVLDSLTSPCIDGGDPDAEPLDEPAPNGGRINMGAYGGTAQASLSPYGETSLPGQATNPSPADEAVDVELDVILRWTAGANAVSHDVYFGTESDFRFGMEHPELPFGREFIGNQTETEFAPGWLQPDTTYFWRIDEVNSNGTRTGEVWKFTTTSSSVPPPKGRTCFVAETDVWIDGTLVSMSNVAAGQTITNVACLATVSSQVEKIEEHEGIFTCYDILLESGNCISVVENHYFLTESGQWISLKNLKKATRLQTPNGSIGIVNITKRPMPYTGKVYNLKVEGSDRYLVGKDAVIVRDY